MSTHTENSTLQTSSTGSRSAVGLSLERCSATAGRVAAESALAALGDSGNRQRPKPNGAIVFATAAHDQAVLLRSIRTVLGDIPIAGCSGEGVIAGNESLERDYACSVLAIHSPQLDFHAYLHEAFDDAPREIGKRLADEANTDAGDKPALLMLFPDGLRGDCTAMLAALKESLKPDITVIGGAAADGMLFERTYQYARGRAYTGAVGAMLISGGPEIEIALSHGCTPLGSKREITRGSDGWVHEIDGVPAWDVLRTYLSGDPQDLNAQGIVHLCIGIPTEHEEGDIGDKYIVRTPLDLDKSTGALRVPGGGLDTGTAVCMMRRDPTTIRQSLEESATHMRERIADRSPLMVLQFDCAGRGRILFGGCASEEIVAPVRRSMAPTVPWIGCHTYGEIAPIHGQTSYHNYTAVVCAVLPPKPREDALE